MSAKRLIVTGRVQAVGYRAWAVRQAIALGIAGWVRNRRGGEVELLLDGASDAVEEMVRACRRGPRAAEVARIEEYLEPAIEQSGFIRLPTA